VTQLLTSTRSLRAAALTGSFLLVLVLSISSGPDANWDLLNYHYSNGRALVTGAFLSDVSAAGLQSYLHPLIDAPVYVMVELLGGRWGLVVWSAVVQWLCYLTVWRLAGCFNGLSESWVRRTVAVAVVASGAGALSLAFTTFGDWIVAALLCEATRGVLLAIDGVVEADDDRRTADRRLVIAGVFVGLALSVKLASGTFALGIVAGIALTLGLAAAMRSLIGAVVSFLVVSGPWMLFLTVRYGNPVFPFYNRIFRSESAPVANFDDTRYGSHGLIDIVRFPVEMFRGGIEYTELELRDWRYVAVLVMVAAVAVIATSERAASLFGGRKRIVYLASSWLIGFVTWIVAFGIYRYFLFGEVIVSLMIAALIAQLLVDQWRFALVAAVLLPIGIGYQQLPEWGRGDVFANPELDRLVESAVPPSAHVVFAGGPPISYLSESFPASTRFAGLYGFASGDLVDDGRLHDDLERFVADGLADESLFVISDSGVTQLPAPLDALWAVDCAPFTSLTRPLQLCAVAESP
jgi:hypothetical protein